MSPCHQNDFERLLRWTASTTAVVCTTYVCVHDLWIRHGRNEEDAGRRHGHENFISLFQFNSGKLDEMESIEIFCGEKYTFGALENCFVSAVRSWH